MKIQAFAKINLTLDVTGKREDGFHTLDTVMHSVTLGDTVELIRSREPGVRLRSDRDYLPSDERNTAYRAAALFFQDRGLTGEGLEIVLEKGVPSRAGLGGGSADAAAVLRGLNEMFEAKLPVERLMELGKTIGADVPFCVHGGCCRCRGIGELLEELPPMPHCFLALCKPPVGMSTPRAYAMLDRYPLVRNGATPRMIEALESGDLRQIGKAAANRFDETMKLMQVGKIKRIMLSAGAFGAMMSGSGSAVYGIFDAREKAEACLVRLAPLGETFLAEPCAGR